MKINNWLKRFFCVHHWIWGEVQNSWMAVLVCDKCWKSKTIINRLNKPKDNF